MTAHHRPTPPPVRRALSSIDLEGPEITLTLEEWHRSRDGVDEPLIVVPHQSDLQAA